MISKLLFLLPFLFSTSLFADCSTVNLITAPKSPFAKIPVYDQDGIGTCYAYSASQLIDYHLIKNGGKRSVHPLWAALKYSDAQNNSSISGGECSSTIKALSRAGNCDQEKVSKAIKAWANKANVKEAEVVHLIEKLAPEMKKILSKKKKTNPKAKELSAKEVEVAVRAAIKQHEPFCSAGATWENLIPALKSLKVLDSTVLLSNLVMPGCSSNLTKLKIPSPTVLNSSSDNGWEKNLNNKLNDKLPVSVSYCAKVLREGSHYRGVTKRGGFFTNNVKTSDCGPHESLVVGKKKIGNQCHYLVRNSWGAGFNSGYRKWNCLCKEKKTGKFLDNCTASKHNNGKYTVEGCWINGKALSANIYEGTVLEPISTEDLRREAMKKPWY